MKHPPTIPGDLLLRPRGRDWPGLVRHRGDDRSRTLRRELGLGVDRPVVMSGHQATLWHAGILAKWLAIAHAAERNGWHAALVGVDHDAVRPMAVRWPVRRGEALGVAEADLGGASLGGEIPGCMVPATAPAALPARAGEPALASVGEGLAAVRAALAAHAAARSGAEQVLLATRDLIHAAVLAGVAPTLVLATRLGETTLYRALVERMRAEPLACATAYNRAIGDVAGLRPLDVTGDVELPLWKLEGLTRRSVRASMLAGGAAGLRLAPKALLLTLVLRMGACDLFVHGTGGGGLHEGEGYDRAADAWARLWLGEELAPIATVSATLRLPLGDGEVVSHKEAERAAWRAWHARHDPAMLGLGDLDARRRELVGAIAGAPRRGRARAEAFAALQGVLVEARERGRARLASLDEEARVAARRADEDAVRDDRTWAFPLLPPAMLRGLSERIARDFAGGAGEGMP